jgi:hypothetical protein
LFVVSLARRFILMSVLGPTAEILSFAPPKESIQRKGGPDAAYSLRSESFERGCLKGLPSPCMQRAASLRRPYGLIRSKAPVLGAANGRKPSRKLKEALFIFWYHQLRWLMLFCPRIGSARAQKPCPRYTAEGLGFCFISCCMCCK